MMLSNYNNPAETLTNRRHNAELKFSSQFLEALSWLFIALLIGVTYFEPIEGNVWLFIVPISLFGIWKILRAFRYIKKIRLIDKGLSTERKVGHFLYQSIAPHGYRILNSINLNGYDIDHLAIGPAGIFCIETKSLQWKKTAKITVKQSIILVDNQPLPHKDPIKQAKQGAVIVHEFLEAQNIIKYVTPTILFPERVVHATNTTSLFVGNLKQFKEYVMNKKPVLSAKQIKLFADKLSHLGGKNL